MISQHALQQVSGGGGVGFQAHNQVLELRGIWPEGSLQAQTQGVSRPTPVGSIPACTEADPPPPAAGGTHPTGCACGKKLFV